MATRTTRPVRTLRDRLAHLTYQQACKLLGKDAKQLLRTGTKLLQDVELDRDVYFRGDVFRITLPRSTTDRTPVRATITVMQDKLRRLCLNCDACRIVCKHTAAALAFVLDEKFSLGLSDIPKEGTPLERLSEDDLEQRAIAERRVRAKTERFRLVSENPAVPWTDYLITSLGSGKTYRIALRGEARGESYCACPDFRTNTLGTCKHLLYALQRVKSRFSAAQLARKYVQREFAVHLRYGQAIELRLLVPDSLPSLWRRRLAKLMDRPIDDVPGLLNAVQMLRRGGHEVVIYPDAEEWIQQRLHDRNVAGLVQEMRSQPASHPLRTQLLKVPLLPYQLDGIAFAVGAGRAVLADDMGLGKTIQGIGVAELLAQVAGINRVLVVCPTSLKAQWCSEIQRFCDRDVQLVMGSGEERALQYDNHCFFTVCNYEQVLRDLKPISQVKWDLIVLDEGQRIKNWETKTSRVVKSLRSRFALVLSGTPLENRLDELYSVVQFIDDRRLGPGFRFFHRHRVVDEDGKIVGYRNLDQLRAMLRPVLLRRTRASVLQQLPERNTEVVRILASAEQAELSWANVQRAAQIASKRFLTEMDLLRIQQHLLVARMAANSTFLVDKQEPGCSTKLEYLAELFEQLWEQPDRKVVLFSEWTTMLDLIERQLARFPIEYVRLDGAVPQRKRQQLVHRFQHDPTCRLFMTTNAGSTGLNLQAANTVINVDLPWNPAVLEQRISRAHRMGQRRPVDVYLLVSTQTFEERLLMTLEDKRELALAALDPDSNVKDLNLRTQGEDLRQRLERLLGERPPAPEAQLQQRAAQQEVEDAAARQERLAEAGTQVVSAVCRLVNDLVPATAPAEDHVVQAVRGGLESLVRHDAQGRPQLQLTLPSTDSLNELAGALARLLGVTQHST